MISRTVKIQLVVFLLLSFFGVVYTGFNYVGIHAIGPVHFSPGPYTVKMMLTDSGGIYETAPVTYRGVAVGTVGSLRLTTGGVEVDLKIDHNIKIPMDTTAQVANLSAVGEQYVNLTPQSDGGPYMNANFVISQDHTSIPVADATLLQNLDTTVNSVDRKNLAIVIAELGKATAGTGPALSQLISSGDALLTSAQAALPQTLKLADDGKTVLNTQAQVATQFKTFSHNLNLLSQQLVTSDPDLRKLFDNGVTASQTLQQLLAANQKNLPTLLSNLVTLGTIQAQRLPGLQEVLVLYPFIISDAYTALDQTDGSGSATAQFASASTSAPVACDASGTGSGYQSTMHRNENVGPPANNSGTDASGAKTVAGLGGPVNLNTICTAPDQAPNGTTGSAAGSSEARGAPTTPRPKGDTTGLPGGSVGTSTNPNVPNYYTAVPAGSSSSARAFSLNGSTYELGNQTATPPGYAGSALSFLLLAGAAGS